MHRDDGRIAPAAMNPAHSPEVMSHQFPCGSRICHACIKTIAIVQNKKTTTTAMPIHCRSAEARNCARFRRLQFLGRRDRITTTIGRPPVDHEVETIRFVRKIFATILRRRIVCRKITISASKIRRSLRPRAINSYRKSGSSPERISVRIIDGQRNPSRPEFFRGGISRAGGAVVLSGAMETSNHK